MTFQLFDDQDDLLDRTRQAMRRHRRVMMQLPTGGGKTVIAAKAISNATAKGHRTWFLLHRRELVKQSVVTLGEAAGLPLGIVAAGFPGDRHQPVQVCSIGTVARRLDMLPEPTLMVWDEAHHLAAGSWAAIMARYPKARHLGLSATPERLDGAGLSAYFEELVCGPTVRELIDARRLADYRLYAPEGLDTSGVHTLAGEFNKKELAAVVAKSRVVGDALSHYRKYCPGARAIVFNVSIEESIKTVAAFNEAGIRAEHVDGTTDDVVRDNAIQNFKAGRTLILSNVNLFSEGFDVPAVEAVFDLAPTKSLAMYLQRCGRALRPAQGKDVALLFDHAGNSRMHGLPDDDREWTLDGRRKKARSSDGPPVKQCPLCFATVAGAASVCRHCNYKFVMRSREIEQVDGELTPVARDAMRRSSASYEWIERQAAQRGLLTFEQWILRHGHSGSLGYESKGEPGLVSRYRSYVASSGGLDDLAGEEQALADTLEKLIEIGRLRGYKAPEKWASHVWKGRAAKSAADEARKWAQAGYR